MKSINIEGKHKEILDELLRVSRDIVGVYFDAVTGIERNLNSLEKDQIRFLEEAKKDNPDLTLEKLDEAAFAYGEGDPNISMPEIFHISSQKEYKARNSRDGKNCQFIGNMCLITIFQYWEDYYRGELAKSYGFEKDDVKADLFGDIGLIRNSIIHCNSIASDKIIKCKILKWFKPGDRIFVDKNKLLEIIMNIQHFRLEFIIKKNK